MLDKVDADVRIAVLDACASGAITRIKGGQRRAAFLLDTQTDTRGYAFLTSSSAQESAQESDRIGASYFTYYLVTVMRVAADVTADGRVTLSEAYQFAFDETLARTVDLSGGAQHPAYDMNLSGTGDVVLTDVRRVSAGISLHDDVEGRLFVRAADRRLVAELYKPSGRAIELAWCPTITTYTSKLDVSCSSPIGTWLTGSVCSWQQQISRPHPGRRPKAGEARSMQVHYLPQPWRRQVVSAWSFTLAASVPMPKAHRVLAEASAPADELTEGSRLTPIVESVGQVQPWGALSGLTVGYALDRHWEVTLSWGALTSDVDENLVDAADSPRTLRQVKLTSVLLGARWFPLRTNRWRPFAGLAVAASRLSRMACCLAARRSGRRVTRPWDHSSVPVSIWT